MVKSVSHPISTQNSNMYITKYGTYITIYTAVHHDIEYTKLQDFRRKQSLTRHVGMKIMTIFMNFGVRKEKDRIFGSSGD